MSELLRHKQFKQIIKAFSVDDIITWFYRDNIFKRTEQDKPESKLNFHQFKQYFFPHLMQIQDDEDVRGGPGAMWEKGFMDYNKMQDKSSK
jgi:hypothetical protein